jgi:hypothetical protein
MNAWHEHEAIIGTPVAAPLAKCAQLLGVTLDELKLIAEQVEPYQHAEGYPVWSVYQLDRHLHPENYGRATGGTPTLKARGASARRRNARSRA